MQMFIGLNLTSLVFRFLLNLSLEITRVSVANILMVVSESSRLIVETGRQFHSF